MINGIVTKGIPKRAQELVDKIADIIREANKEFKVMVCEKDDGDAVSVPKSVEYDPIENKIYINANYE